MNHRKTVIENSAVNSADDKKKTEIKQEGIRDF